VDVEERLQDEVLTSEPVVVNPGFEEGRDLREQGTCIETMKSPWMCDARR